MRFCIAPASSCALVFSHEQMNGAQRVAFNCFSEKVHCDEAAQAANQAFTWSFSKDQATCEEQPAGDPTVAFTIIPFGH